MSTTGPQQTMAVKLRLNKNVPVTIAAALSLLIAARELDRVHGMREENGNGGSETQTCEGQWAARRC